MKYIARAAGEWQQCPGYAKKILLTEQDLNAAGTLTQRIKVRRSIQARYLQVQFG
jgi:hypothetical protein